MLKVYCISRVNQFARGNTRDLRVLWALEEMGLPYAIVGMDHPNHDLDSDAFRAMNPFRQIPVIDDDGVVVTESGAILLYLARKTGKLMPRDLGGEAQVPRWSVAALSSVEVPVLTLWFVGISGGEGTKPHDALRQWSGTRLKQLDAWLANRSFVATDDFTVADILMTHVLSTGSTDQSTARAVRAPSRVSDALHGAARVEAHARRVLRTGRKRLTRASRTASRPSATGARRGTRPRAPDAEARRCAVAASQLFDRARRAHDQRGIESFAHGADVR